MFLRGAFGLCLDSQWILDGFAIFFTDLLGIKFRLDLLSIEGVILSRSFGNPLLCALGSFHVQVDRSSILFLCSSRCFCGRRGHRRHEAWPRARTGKRWLLGHSLQAWQARGARPAAAPSGALRLAHTSATLTQRQRTESWARGSQASRAGRQPTSAWQAGEAHADQHRPGGGGVLQAGSHARVRPKRGTAPRLQADSSSPARLVRKRAVEAADACSIKQVCTESIQRSR